MLSVYKYGGTSLVRAVPALLARVQRACLEGQQIVLVLSARGHTTDVLLRRGLRLGYARYSERLDTLLSLGERESVAFIAPLLAQLGLKVRALTPETLGLKVSAQPGRARVLGVDTRAIDAALADGAQVVVVPGFLGMDAMGVLRTLGRGGSDWTALALAHALKAPCSIFTDVEGVYTADPRYVPEAQLRPYMSHAALLALASAGAQVMQARAMVYAQAMGIPFKVASSQSDHPGTAVLPQVPGEAAFWGVALHRRQAYIQLKGIGSSFATELFQALRAWDLFVDPIWQQPEALAFTLDYDELPLLHHALRSAFGALKARNCSISTPIAKLTLLQSPENTQNPLDPRPFQRLKVIRALHQPHRLVFCLPPGGSIEAYRAVYKG